MKKLFALTGMFLILVFTGCQENQLTEPVSTLDLTEPVASLDKTSSLPSNWIKICCPVFDPTYGGCSVEGKVQYKITILPPGAYPNKVADNLTRIKLMLLMDANLCNIKALNKWVIYGLSNNQFKLRSDQVITVAKNYTVSNRNDVVLRVVYNVEVNRVTINKIFLRKI